MNPEVKNLHRMVKRAAERKRASQLAEYRRLSLEYFSTVLGTFDLTIPERKPTLLELIRGWGLKK